MRLDTVRWIRLSSWVSTSPLAPASTALRSSFGAGVSAGAPPPPPGPDRKGGGWGKGGDLGGGRVIKKKKKVDVDRRGGGTPIVNGILPFSIVTWTELATSYESRATRLRTLTNASASLIHVPAGVRRSK